MTSRFRFLDDIAVADCAFEASGETPSELFTAAAQALITTLADPSTVGTSWQRTLERQDPDLPTLLFDWLSEIVYLKDAEGVVYQEVTAKVSQDSETGTWQLRGTLTGEAIDPQRQELRADVKAVTKHLYEIWHEDACWTARVILDI